MPIIFRNKQITSMDNPQTSYTFDSNTTGKKQNQQPNLLKTNSKNLETCIQTIVHFTPIGQKPWVEEKQQLLI